jgi:3-oxoacyl-[acyl-carrier-protein] synthase II
MRIWVTGIGVVSPLGRGARATMDALLAGERGFGEMTLFDASDYRSQIAAQVDDLGPSKAETWSRTDTMAALAAREALAQAGIDDEEVDLIIGGTTAGMFETESILAEMHGDPEASV